MTNREQFKKTVKELTNRLEEDANLFLEIASVLDEAKTRVQKILVQYMEGEVSPVTFAFPLDAGKPPVEKKKRDPKKNISTVVARFLHDYHKKGDTFTLEEVRKRVHGLIPDAKDNTIMAAIYSFEKKHKLTRTSVAKNGINHYMLVDDTTK